jgi:hypothetical protein
MQVEPEKCSAENLYSNRDLRVSSEDAADDCVRQDM